VTAPLALTADQKGTVIAILRAHLPETVTVRVFGSRAAGTCKPLSDLDLVLDGNAPLPLQMIAALAEAFDESDLPFKVDLVDRQLIGEDFRRIVDRSSRALEA
jgi:uncharacterized protein